MSTQAAHAAPLDRMFQALADPARRRMIERLSRGSASVTELAQPHAMSLPAILQHLQVLETSGLVKSEKVGRVRTCRLEEGELHKVEQWVASRRATWQQRFDRLGYFLAAEESTEKMKLKTTEKTRRKR